MTDAAAEGRYDCDHDVLCCPARDNALADIATLRAANAALTAEVERLKRVEAAAKIVDRNRTTNVLPLGLQNLSNALATATGEGG
jgi:hypothetical protein